MEYSKNILNSAEKPNFKVDGPEFLKQEAIKHIHLQLLGQELFVGFDTIELDGEVCLTNISYATELSGNYLGILDALIGLFQNRPAEAIDRFPIKELDYFLRDDRSVSAMPGYSRELYELLSVGEELKLSVFGQKSKEVTIFDPKVSGEFCSLSFTEQIELFEEFMAYHIHPLNMVEIEQLGLDDVSDISITIECEKALTSEFEQEFVKLLKEKLFLQDVVVVIFRVI